MRDRFRENAPSGSCEDIELQFFPGGKNVQKLSENRCTRF